jgi:hypothetical protein
MTARPPPQDLTAEAALLAEVLAAAPTIEDPLAAALDTGLTADDFHDLGNGAAFAAMLRLRGSGQPVSVPLLAGEMERAGRPDLGTAHLLGLEAQGTGAGSAYIKAHARRVREVARHREVERLGRVLQQAALDGDDDTLAKAAAELTTLTAGHEGAGSVTVNLDRVSVERVTWLWPAWLPRGKLVMLDGDPGKGKSTLLLDIIARLTTGTPFPDEGSRERGTPQTCVLLTAEDDLADTVVPRLLAAGANLSRVVSVNGVRVEGGARPLMIPEDVPTLARIMREERAALVAIDPIAAFFGPDVNPWKDTDVRRALRPLAMIAAETSAAVVMIRHLVKGKRESALHKGGGSIAFAAAARAVHLVGDDPDAEGVRVLAPVKSNLAPMPPALRFQLAPVTQHECARVAWLGASQHRADHLISDADQREQASARAEATEWLADQLTSGPVPVASVQRAAERDGHAWSTLKRAKNRLNVRAIKAGKGGWSWELPPKETTPSVETLGPLGPLGPLGQEQEDQGSQGDQESQEGDLAPLPSQADGNGRPDWRTCPRCKIKKAFDGPICKTCLTPVQQALQTPPREDAHDHLEGQPAAFDRELAVALISGALGPDVRSPGVLAEAVLKHLIETGQVQPVTREPQSRRRPHTLWQFTGAAL